MKIETIIKALKLDTADKAACLLLGEDDLTRIHPEEPVNDAWQQVQDLRRQKAQLTEIWPDRATKFDDQFNEQVAILATKLHEQIFDTIP